MKIFESCKDNMKSYGVNEKAHMKLYEKFTTVKRFLFHQPLSFSYASLIFAIIASHSFILSAFFCISG